MQFLFDELRSLSDYAALKEALQKRGRAVSCGGVCEGARAPLCGALSSDLALPLVFLAPDDSAAASAARALGAFFERVLFLPARDFSLYTADTQSEAFGAQRLGVLDALSRGAFDALVCTPQSACQTTLPPQILSRESFSLAAGDTVSPEALCERLVCLGYESASRVEGEGQFSRRGGIVDFFSPAAESPSRVEFFGDTVETVRLFDPGSQRSSEVVASARVLPSRELFLTADAKATALALVEKALSKKKRSPAEEAFLLAQKEALETGALGAADALLPLVYERADLFDYLPDALLFVLSPKRASEALADARLSLTETLSALAETGIFALSHEFLLLREEDSFLDALLERRTVFSAVLEENTFADTPFFSFSTRSSGLFGENLEVLCGLLAELEKAQFRIRLFVGSEFSAENLALSLKDRGFDALHLSPEKAEREDARILVFSGTDSAGRPLVLSGFELSTRRFCLLTEEAATTLSALSKKRRTRKGADSPARALSTYTELSVGDYVVHEAYGIGQYMGIEPISRDGVTRDFLKLRFAGTDVLYVPCSNLSPVSKYVGKGADGALALSHIGTAAWRETKKRARTAAKEIARELCALYAQRQNSAGYQFSKDTPWQAQFEDAFEYNETAGQMRASEEIKGDMEKARPMDRLLCGDVGFGKTEVALRGVFKCVMEGKQAAILAPTTLLANQHYRTVLARFRGYPVRVGLLSRFCTKKELARTLASVRDGSCDIVIGTHRLLQKDVVFSDLGFLVVDEEQRFGVSHKEKLKQLARNVDVLTLSATPIPRTLNMALSGVRDLSLLEEAPGDRLPVQTYVVAFDDALVLEAIRRELRRRGQVFYLVNNIERLSARASFLRANLPGARIRFAHGRQDKEELAALWSEMVEGEIDVLVCTTIIETGIDLARANTLIVEHAERFGLSQLHQLRGRIGRSFRKAYAYFTYPAQRALPELAQKRLDAVREYTRFGAGFQLAMRDLELRGAGTLLGAAQSGHLEKVGYELYLRILSEEVSKERGEEVEKNTDCVIDLPIRARLSEKYVPASTDRIFFYKRFSQLESDAQEAPLRAELTDRFGALPQEAEDLFFVARLRRQARDLGFEKVSFSENTLRFFAPSFPEELCALLAAVYGRAFFVSGGERPHMNLKSSAREAVEAAQEFLFHFREFQQENP